MHRLKTVLLPVLTLSTLAFAGRVPNNFETRMTPEQATAEQRAIEGLTAAIARNVTTTRDAHGKSHGCVDGINVTILNTLSRANQVGYFQPGRVYPAIARFSPGEGDPNSDDRRPGAHGFALKLLLTPEQQRELLSVHGESTFHVDERYYKTFDIVTISRLNAFFINRISDYGPFFAAKGAAGAAAAAAIKAGQTPQQAATAAQAAFERGYITPEGRAPREREGDLLSVLGNSFTKNPLAETYGSWVPSLYGADRAVKYRLEPCVATDPNAYEVPAAIGGWQRNPNFIKDVLKHELRQRAHCYRLSVQFHRPGFPSVERGTPEWVEGASPYVPVATIDIPQKREGRELVDNNLCERASFNPAHASAAHYPIGEIQRARVGGENFTGIYTAIHNLRNENLNRQLRQPPPQR